MTLSLSIALVLVAASDLPGPDVAVHAFSWYMDQIPNSCRVPDPCRPGRLAQNSLGHLRSFPDGGALTQFGEHFQLDSSPWSNHKYICGLDSDSDGLSNGEELGDPTCEWVRGTTPPRTVGITNPAVHNTNPDCPIPPWLWTILFGWTIIFDPPKEQSC